MENIAPYLTSHETKGKLPIMHAIPLIAHTVWFSFSLKFYRFQALLKTDTNVGTSTSSNTTLKLL